MYQNKTSGRITTACVYYILCKMTSLNKIFDLTKTSFFINTLLFQDLEYRLKLWFALGNVKKWSTETKSSATSFERNVHTSFRIIEVHKILWFDHIRTGCRHMDVTETRSSTCQTITNLKIKMVIKNRKPSWNFKQF